MMKNEQPKMRRKGGDREKEVTTNSISVRPRSGKDLGLMRIEEFINRILEEIKSR